MLPLVLGGIALATAGVGAKKAYDGYEDKEEADEITQEAQERYEETKEELEEKNEEVNDSLEELGESYLEVGKILNEFDTLTQELIKKFNAHKQRGGLDFETSIPQAKLTSMRDFSCTAVGVLGTLAGSSAVGVAAAFATYGGVMALGAASTGTAIASLSGVAATNATLAALGGGSLAAGGFGMAGGTAVLGGVVAAPIIAIAGFAYASHGAECLKKAREYEEQVDEACEKMQEGIDRLDEVIEYSNDLQEGIESCLDIFNDVYFDTLKDVDEFLSSGGSVDEIHEALCFDSDTSLKEAQNQILRCVDNGYKFASIIVDIVTTPIFKYEENRKIKLDECNRVIKIAKGYSPKIETDEAGNVLNYDGLEIAKSTLSDIEYDRDDIMDFVDSKFD
ncbi:chemotaxis protein [Helicobacter cetorum]|uniref:chemotaxis protein n=1 Tax=Helicobacter cetorum TaxID=138563 RepID=UPI000CF02B6C|nr:chemotaxis protein [Helicobacter cetorum]